MGLKIISSADGSDTLFNPELKETYHSQKGALAESMHVFINEGLLKVASSKDVITVLEVGFGTGLNALLTLDFSENQTLKIRYVSLETSPLPSEIYLKLNYPEYYPGLGKSFELFHTSPWNQEVNMSHFFLLHKVLCPLEEFEGNELQADVIYFDAFAPSRQPNIWSLANLSKCFELMKPGGILVTYCAQGQFKRDLKAAGFEVETLPGPPGKKEMTRGVKIK